MQHNFQKIVKCDTFIFLDDVQFPRSGAGVNANRVKMIVSEEARWVTATIDRNFEGNRNINQMEFNGTVLWREKILKTIETNYRKQDHFTFSTEYCHATEKTQYHPCHFMAHLQLVMMMSDD